jgi:hypothetical protein
MSDERTGTSGHLFRDAVRALCRDLRFHHREQLVALNEREVWRIAQSGRKPKMGSRPGPLFFANHKMAGMTGRVGQARAQKVSRNRLPDSQLFDGCNRACQEALGQQIDGASFSTGPRVIGPGLEVPEVERFVCCYSPKFFSPTIDRGTYLKGAHAMLSKTEHLDGCLKEVLRQNQLELNIVSSCPNFATLLLMVSKAPILATLPSTVTSARAARKCRSSM